MDRGNDGKIQRLQYIKYFGPVGRLITDNYFRPGEFAELSNHWRIVFLVITRLNLIIS